MSDNYQFARASAVSNAGEDLLGSARHIRNQWRGLIAAEQDGTATELLTRDHLLKNEPPKLTETITPSTAIAHLAAHAALKVFPPVPFTEEEYRRYDLYVGRRSVVPKSQESFRQDYYEAYLAIKLAAETAALQTANPFEVLNLLTAAVEAELAKLSGNFNLIGIALLDYKKRLYVSPRDRPKYKTTQVAFKILEFSGRLQAKYSDPAVALNHVRDHVLDIVLKGYSLNKTFGTVGSKSQTFDPASAYETVGDRQGGRAINCKTGDDLMRQFGFRGVQFGNYVSDKERIAHLESVAGAFADLADVTGFSDKQMSLGGRLGIAIGARGRTGSLAHYEPSQEVINLSRERGFGALSHEWGHALDHWLTGCKITTGGGKQEAVYLSSTIEQYGAVEPYNSEISVAMGAVLAAIAASTYPFRLRQALRDKIAKKQIPRTKVHYWLCAEEVFARTFERYVQYQLGLQERKNSYLSGSNSCDLWVNQEEMHAIAPAMTQLLSTIRSYRNAGVLQL